VFLFPYRLWAFYKPTPVPAKSSFRYNSMFNFIPVSFFFVNFRLGSVIGLGLGFRIGFGIGNLKNISIGGAAGIVDIPVRKSAVSESELTIPGTKVPGNIQLNSTHQAT